MDINKWAVDKVNEHVATIKWYLDEGMDKQWAISYVLDSSVLGDKYKAMVIEMVEQEYYNQVASV